MSISPSAQGSLIQASVSAAKVLSDPEFQGQALDSALKIAKEAAEIAKAANKAANK